MTGDLVSHPRGEPRLRELLARLERPFVVLGNHDVAVTRDPFSRAAELRDLEQAVLLRDADARSTSAASASSVVGVDPVAYRARPGATGRAGRRDGRRSASSSVTSRAIVDRIPAGAFDLILAGPPPRRPDLPPATAGAASRSRTRSARFVAGRLRDGRRRHARLAGHGHDVRPVPVLRAARGDGARPARGGLDWRRGGPRGHLARRARVVRGRCGARESRASASSSTGPRRHRGVRVTEDDGVVRARGACRARVGRARARGRDGGAEARRGVPRAHGEAPVGRRRRRRRRHRRPAGRWPQASPGSDARNAPVGAVRLPRLRLVAVARQQDRLEGALDRPGRGGLGRVGDDLPRRGRPPPRVAAVRPVAPLPARRRPARRARRPTTPCS